MLSFFRKTRPEVVPLSVSVYLLTPGGDFHFIYFKKEIKRGSQCKREFPEVTNPFKYS